MGVTSNQKQKKGEFFAGNNNGDQGEILSFYLTPGNVDDRNPEVIEHLTKELFGKLFADKGYLSSKLFRELFGRGPTLVTKLKKNMKSALMDFSDKLMLRKRAVIESVNDFLKNICQIEHSRHRAPIRAISKMIAYIPSHPP